MAKVGRNEPCPCGSGKKYKQCHARDDEVASLDSGRAASLHELDRELVERLGRFARKTLGERWVDGLFDLLEVEEGREEELSQLLVPCAIFEWEPEGGKLVARFLEAPGQRLSERERGWLEAQRASWLSIWEVLEVNAGSDVLVRDFFTGEERRVLERRGSMLLKARDGLLGRVVDFEGVSVFCGMHPRTLPPRPTAGLVEHIRKLAKLRTKPLSPDALRVKLPFDALTIDWEVEVDEYDASIARPPTLRNTDGDDVLLTNDRFVFAERDRKSIEARLDELVERDDAASSDAESAYVFLRPGNAMHQSWDNTIVGRAIVRGSDLVIETNSLRRADELRKQVETSLAGLVRHRLRDHEDPEASLRDGGRLRAGGHTRAAPPATRTPEEVAIVRDFKQRHYEGWLDDAIPALGGLTPREAAVKPKKRNDLVLLLKELENHEAHVPADERFDVSELRRELGLES